MKIGPHDPLPDHTKYDYYECLAMLTLMEVFPERYKECRIMDRPDIQCLDVGVEVTIGDKPQHLAAENNWVKANNSDGENKQTYISRMGRLGEKYTGGVQFWSKPIATVNDLLLAIKAKIEKGKKGNYSIYPRVELFVFTELWLYEDLVPKVAGMIEKIGAYEVFPRIIIFEEGSVIHLFENKHYQVISLDDSVKSELPLRARQMVIDNEENSDEKRK